MKHKLLFAALSLVLVLVSACQPNGHLFERIDGQQTGVSFENKIDETIDANYFKYMYMYIGGGVATADFNNDGLEDLFFVSNSFDNKLYLNKGDFRFEDISQQAGIIKRPGFDVGAAVADVNNDGWLDIYITRGGWKPENNGFANMLYINNGIQKQPDGSEGITFTEKAKEYGLDDSNRGVAASFFDYDRDGDLDVYISNTPDFEDKGNVILDLTHIQTDTKTVELKGSDKLYRNDGKNHFSDVSISAGIMPDIGFGLSPQVGDLNADGWLDIYVCNDFRIPDFAYINNRDGTFSDQRNQSLKHISFNSMGADIGDINNDGFMDLYTLDMNPEDYVRAKTTMGMTSTNMFNLMVNKNYHHQYMHNMLQLNNGDGTFSEIANMAGVANTDWSWSCLFADFDLDGYNDIYVTNGVFRDVIDRDVNNEILQTLHQRGTKPTEADFLLFAKKLPQQKLNNYLFRNKGDLTFENVSVSWTKEHPTFSNGATYADLDNDGDLDLIVSNLNQEATILKNLAIENDLGMYLKVKVDGPVDNKQGIGTTVKIKSESGQIKTRQLITTRGFLSSVSPILHFGFSKNDKIESIEVVWPDGKGQHLKNIDLNRVLTIKYAPNESTDLKNIKKDAYSLFEKININFSHHELDFNDYEHQLLLPQKFSQMGPALASGDVNGDGLDDLYLGGSYKEAGQLLIAQKDNGFSVLPSADFDSDRLYEDVDAVFFDADGDKDLDLYVVSGSYEFEINSPLLADRLYINDGKGYFTRSYDRLPELTGAGSVVAPADFDGDGDMDIFVGSRLVPGMYPLAPTSVLLKNTNGVFSIETTAICPELERVGMVTDALWTDMDGDNQIDLVVCGEWMGIEVFLNKKDRLVKSEKYPSLSNTKGWWNKIIAVDIDNDGDNDIVAGNMGLNSKYKASSDKPFQVYANDFDYNGTVDIILADYYQKKQVPVRGRVSILQQVPSLGAKLHTFQEFAAKDLHEIFGKELENATHLIANEFRSGIFINEGAGQYNFRPFENCIQSSTLNSILFEDFDKDGIKDLLLAGNNYQSETETTRNDAGTGYFLKGEKKGVFRAMPYRMTGFLADKDVRKMVVIKGNGKMKVAVANNNESLEVFQVNYMKTALQ